LELGLAGTHYVEIASQVGVDDQTVAGWLNQARQAGHKVPYAAEVIRNAEVEEIAPLHLPQAEILSLASGNHKGGLVAVERAAEALGVSVAEYVAKREAALAFFDKGQGAAWVARQIGFPIKVVYNWKSYHRKKERAA
jgi:transposase-like protein